MTKESVAKLDNTVSGSFKTSSVSSPVLVRVVIIAKWVEPSTRIGPSCKDGLEDKKKPEE